MRTLRRHRQWGYLGARSMYNHLHAWPELIFSTCTGGVTHKKVSIFAGSESLHYYCLLCSIRGQGPLCTRRVRGTRPVSALAALLCLPGLSCSPCGLVAVALSAIAAFVAPSFRPPKGDQWSVLGGGGGRGPGANLAACLEIKESIFEMIGQAGVFPAIYPNGAKMALGWPELILATRPPVATNGRTGREENCSAGGGGGGTEAHFPNPSGGLFTWKNFWLLQPVSNHPQKDNLTVSTVGSY